MLYAQDVVPNMQRPNEAGMRLLRLTEFFGAMSADDVTPSSAIAYERWRTHSAPPSKGEPPRRIRAVKAASVRRELEDLRAALRHAFVSRMLTREIPVKMPPKGSPRERYLTRSEAARLLASSIGFRFVSCSDIRTRKERWVVWSRDRINAQPHLGRFILIGLRTGTRHETILSLGFRPHLGGGHFDLETRILYRSAAGAAQEMLADVYRASFRR